MHPELEKGGLLAPLEGYEQRRPADVYLPAWVHGCPAALDLAVTSPQRQSIVDLASREPLASAHQYSQTKREYFHTFDACREAGVEFIPLVCETTGAWSKEAMVVFGHMAKAAVINIGRDSTKVLQESLQVLSVAARRCQARALLRRITLSA